MEVKKSILVLSKEDALISLFKSLIKKISISVEPTFSQNKNQAQELLKNRSFNLVIAEEGWILESCFQSVPSTSVIWVGEEKKNKSNHWVLPFSIDKMKAHIKSLLSSQKPVSIIGGLMIQQLLQKAQYAAQYDVPVLITGKSGTGKELVAQFIHQKSSRNNNPFVVVNCGAIPFHLIESELFGYKKGAFTGAVSDKKGIFESAHKGTLFLDEIGELPLALQAKLLRALQEKTIRPLGSLYDVNVDIRVISATNKNLKDMISKNQFREDLWHRLNLFSIEISSLKKRKEDIPLLAHYFLEKNKVKYYKKNLSFSQEALESLKNYNYPGNIRELENIIEKAVVLSLNSVLTKEDLFEISNEKKNSESNALPFSLSKNSIDLDSVIEQTEKAIIIQAIQNVQGNRAQAAKILNISQRSLKHRIYKYKLAT